MFANRTPALKNPNKNNKNKAIGIANKRKTRKIKTINTIKSNRKAKTQELVNTLLLLKMAKQVRSLKCCLSYQITSL
jgi:hypothetical protein